MDKTIRIVTQAFYGNKTETEIKRKNLDRFILGYLDDNISLTGKQIDRTIINVSDADNVVIIYNKYEEEKALNKKENLFKTKNYELKPLVIIPEKDIKLYSRCIVCRMNENGEFESLHDDDYGKFMKYLAE